MKSAFVFEPYAMRSAISADKFKRLADLAKKLRLEPYATNFAKQAKQDVAFLKAFQRHNLKGKG